MVTEFLLNPIWQFVGVIASAVIAMTIYYLQRRVKRLAFGYASIEADSNNPLLTRQFVIGLVSHGTEAIRQTDFERPLVIMFGENAKDLTYELLRVSPPYLKPNVSTTGNMLTLQPILLNHGDTIVLIMDSKDLEIARLQAKLRLADGMARVCDAWVGEQIIDSRSALSDARLRYGSPNDYEFSANEDEAQTCGQRAA
jgi:hypothetical protein